MKGLLRSFALVLATALLTAVAAGAQAPDGAALYQQHCALCHGDDGRHQTPFCEGYDVHSFAGSDFAKHHGEMLVYRNIMQGFKDEDGTVTMPAYAGLLKSDEIFAIVAYVRAMGKDGEPEGHHHDDDKDAAMTGDQATPDADAEAES